MHLSPGGAYEMKVMKTMLYSFVLMAMHIDWYVEASTLSLFAGRILKKLLHPGNSLQVIP